MCYCSLQVCRLARLTFDPPLLYCNTCGLKIKRGASYYSTPSDTAQEYRGTWCSQCFNEAKGECMPDHTRAKKTDLQVCLCSAVLGVSFDVPCRWGMRTCQHLHVGVRLLIGMPTIKRKRTGVVAAQLLFPALTPWCSFIPAEAEERGGVGRGLGVL